MDLKRKEQLHVLRILKEEGAIECVTPERLIYGKPDNVVRGTSSGIEQGQDKVEGTEEEIREFWGILETHTPPYIRSVPQNNPRCNELTQAGEKYYEQLKAKEIEPLDVNLGSMVFNEKLLAKVTPAFESGNYDTAIRDGCVLLEEAIRDKAGLEEADWGKNLVVKALHHDNGKLTFPECRKPGEAEGVFFLYCGIIEFARNISAHHTKRLNDPQTALQIVAFLDFLFRLLDTAQLR